MGINITGCDEAKEIVQVNMASIASRPLNDATRNSKFSGQQNRNR